MDIKEIKAIIDLMKKNDLSVFKMESEGFKLTLKKGSDFQPLVSYQPAPAAPAPVAAPAVIPFEAPAPAAGGKEVVSPMVGTFYRSPSPESPSYVNVGDSITPETVVCIIEAMKVMNEIKAEVSGVVTEVLVENGKPVQFGQPLLKVK